MSHRFTKSRNSTGRQLFKEYLTVQTEGQRQVRRFFEPLTHSPPGALSSKRLRPRPEGKGMSDGI